MDSKPNLSAPTDFNETQIFAMTTPDDVPFFKFFGFGSDCLNFPPITYDVSTDSNIVTVGESFPSGIQLESDGNYVRLNFSIAGTYDAFIIAK
jgi:hypothetical protein